MKKTFSQTTFECVGAEKSTGGNNKMNNGWILFSCFGFRGILVLCMLARCHIVVTYKDTGIEFSYC